MTKRLLKTAGTLLLLFTIAGFAAPFFNADGFGERLRSALQRSLGRRVEFQGSVRFSMLRGPALKVDKVTIYEDPTIGIEPMAYVEGGMEVRPSIWNLAAGRFVIASIRLEDASINLAKSGAATEYGHWNFASLIDRTVMSTAPAVHVRNGRINFKFGDTKSVFYLTETDLDIVPPTSRTGGWGLYCAAKPARTDRTNQGLGSFVLRGHWFVAPERVDLDLQVDRTALGEFTALVRGQSGNIHGSLSSRLHLGGLIDNIGIQGRVSIEDVHRWDLLPGKPQNWPLELRGRLDLTTQQLELHTSSASNVTPPLTARFRVSDYLSQPHWALGIYWNRFPVEPLLDLATHMGADFAPKLKLGGTMDGAISYSNSGNFQGQLAFHDTALTIPESPPVSFENAYLILDNGHIRLSPALVRIAGGDQAEIEADYEMASQALDLAISTDGMKVESLRSQVALAAVPWLEQLQSGEWNGDLHYHRSPSGSGWTGRLELIDAQVQVPGLADPLKLASVRAQIDGTRVVLDQIEAAAGKVAFTGDYSYLPAAPRRHRVRIRIKELDAADLETELMPTLQRSSSIIARAFGRTNVPDWLKERSADGTLQIDDFLLAGMHLENVRARILWDVTRIDLEAFQARSEGASVSGKLTVSLRSSRPSYKFTGRVKGVEWLSGRMDAEGSLITEGTGNQLLANLTSELTFTGSALDFGSQAPWKNISGTCNLSWSPRLRVTALNFRAEDETYTGRGSVQDDGRLVILLSSGGREMRMSGTLAKLKVEEAAR
jgi:hypothetical protein